MMKKWNWVEWLLLLAVMAGAFYAAFSDAPNFPNRWYTRDDAYYYFKVAQNISEGLGSTFDGINLANGYHPLWMLVNIPIFALARFDLVLPLRVLTLVAGLIHALSAILLYRLISRVLAPVAGVFIAAFWVFSLYINATMVQFGLETGLTALMILLFIYHFQAAELRWRTQPLPPRELLKFSLLALLVVFSRLDTVFLMTFFGFYLVFRALPLRHFLLTDSLGILFFTFAAFIFRVGMKEYYTYGETALYFALLLLLLSLPIYYFAGIDQHPRTQTIPDLLKAIFFSVTLPTALAAALILVLQHGGVVGSFPRSALLLLWGAQLIWVAATRCFVRFVSAPRERLPLAPVQVFKENWKIWLGEGIRFYGIWGGGLALYMLFNRLTFGTFSPVSGQVKRWWGSLAGNVYGGAAKRKYTFFGLDTKADSDFNAWGLFSKFAIWTRDRLVEWLGYADSERAYWWLFFVLLLLIGILLLTSLKRTLRASVDFGLLPLFVGAVTQVISYHATGYAAAKEWYWVTQIIFTLLVLAILLDIFYRVVLRVHPSTRYLSYALTVLLIFVWGRGFYVHIAHLMPYGVEHEGHPYMDILAVVEENTEPGSLIGMTGGGNLGYFIADRTIVNMDGLINSYDYFLAHKEGRGDDYLAAMGLDYVFSNPNLLEDLPYKGEFDGRLGEPIASYRKKSVMKFYQVEKE